MSTTAASFSTDALSGRGAAQRQGSFDYGYLLASIASDLHLCGIEVGATTICLEDCLSPKTDNPLRTCNRLLLADSNAMGLALRYGAEVGLDHVLVSEVEKQYALALQERARLTPYMRSMSLNQAQCVALGAFRGSWRDLAGSLAKTIGRFRSNVGRRLDAEYVADAQAVEEFLNQASMGQHALLDREGNFRAPRLRQRRRTPRVKSQQSCRILTAEGSFSAMLEDLSRTGAGVICSHTINLGAEVRILLSSGRTLPATVARRSGNRYGFTLHRRLAIDDPLLLAGRLAPA